MSDDSDQEITELDVETRTWNKLQTNMKLVGFREGAVKGKDLSLQEGFNSGYLDGFRLGEYFGICKGVINCETELKLPAHKAHLEEVDKLSNQACVVCLQEEMTKISSNELPFENIGDLIKVQQNCSNEIIKTLKTQELEPYFDKG